MNTETLWKNEILKMLECKELDFYDRDHME